MNTKLVLVIYHQDMNGYLNYYSLLSGWHDAMTTCSTVTNLNDMSSMGKKVKSWRKKKTCLVYDWKENHHLKTTVEKYCHKKLIQPKTKLKQKYHWIRLTTLLWYKSRLTDLITKSFDSVKIFGASKGTTKPSYTSGCGIWGPCWAWDKHFSTLSILCIYTLLYTIHDKSQTLTLFKKGARKDTQRVRQI